MLAKSVPTIPASGSYEPKWGGFRSIIFRDGDDVEIGSRNERPMTRYFPELVAAFRSELPARCVVDGEIVLATDAGLDFEALEQRIHPAASRVVLQVAAGLGIDPAPVTCDVDNLASRKVIEANGGRLWQAGDGAMRLWVPTGRLAPTNPATNPTPNAPVSAGKTISGREDLDAVC